MMNGTQTARERHIHRNDRNQSDWTYCVDDENRDLGARDEKHEENTEQLEATTLQDQDTFPFNETQTAFTEFDAENLDSAEFLEVLDDPGFRRDLRVSCKRVFSRYRQSMLGSWEDLQQEVLIRFGKWLPHYRSEAKCSTVFEKIATNVLIDAKRRENAIRRYHQEVNFEELEFELIRERSGSEIEDRIFLNECRSILSDLDRRIFDEFVVKGKSLRQIAKENGISAAAMSKRWSRVITKLHDHEQKGRVGHVLGGTRKEGSVQLQD